MILLLTIVYSQLFDSALIFSKGPHTNLILLGARILGCDASFFTMAMALGGLWPLTEVFVMSDVEAIVSQDCILVFCFRMKVLSCLEISSLQHLTIT